MVVYLVMEMVLARSEDCEAMADFSEMEEVLVVREVKVEMEAEVQATVVVVEVDLKADTGMEEKAMVKGED